MTNIKDQRPILIIDSMNFFIRHFAVNESVTATGEPCGGVVGFIKGLWSLIGQFAPSHVYVIWEQGGGSKRRKHLFPEYKANRAKIKSTFVDMNKEENSLPSKKWIMNDTDSKLKQTKQLVEILKNLPVCQIYVPEVECDDVIAYLIQHKLKEENALKLIVSSDRDFYQLLDDENVKIYNPADKSLHEGPILSVKHDKEILKIPAKNYALIRTLTGDASDNIPGVPGVGFKTALKCFPMLESSKLEPTVNDLIEEAKTQIGNAKKPSKSYASVLSCSDVLRRNWELMYLHSGNLAVNQIAKIEFAVDNFEPQMNKLAMIQIMLREQIITNINFDDLTYDFQRLLY